MILENHSSNSLKSTKFVIGNHKPVFAEHELDSMYPNFKMNKFFSIANIKNAWRQHFNVITYISL